MSRKNLTPEQKERKLIIREFLKTNPFKDGNDPMALMLEMMAEVVEDGIGGSKHYPYLTSEKNEIYFAKKYPGTDSFQFRDNLELY